MVKALQYKRFGQPEVLELVDLLTLEPKTDEVSIKVSHVGLNPMDWAIMGHPEVAPNFGVKLPQTFAYDFAGKIDQIGAEVTDFKVGDRVFGTTMKGAATEQLIASAKEPGLYHTPDFIENDVAPTLAVAGLTAAVALRKAHVKNGDTLLIGGAAGGVGIFAVQLAQLWGAKVIGTASDSTADFLKELGAEQVAYGEGLTDRLKVKGITAAIDLHSFESLNTALELGVKADKMSTVIMYPEHPAGVPTATGGEAIPSDMEMVLTAIGSHQLTVPIAAKFPINDYLEAVNLQMSRHTHGKIVLYF